MTGLALRRARPSLVGAAGRAPRRHFDEDGRGREQDGRQGPRAVAFSASCSKPGSRATSSLGAVEALAESSWRSGRSSRTCSDGASLAAPSRMKTCTGSSGSASCRAIGSRTPARRRRRSSARLHRRDAAARRGAFARGFSNALSPSSPADSRLPSATLQALHARRALGRAPQGGQSLVENAPDERGRAPPARVRTARFGLDGGSKPFCRSQKVCSLAAVTHRELAFCAGARARLRPGP